MMSKGVMIPVLIASLFAVHPLSATGKGWGNIGYDIDEIVGNLWGGRAVRQGTVEDMLEILERNWKTRQPKIDDSSDEAKSDSSSSSVDIVNECEEFLKDVSIERNENEAHMGNIQNFVEMLHRIENSVSPEILRQGLSLIEDNF